MDQDAHLYAACNGYLEAAIAFCFLRDLAHHRKCYAGMHTDPNIACAGYEHPSMTNTVSLVA